MFILSIDVGIKNLALCIIQILNDKSYKIILWEIINLCDDSNNNCCLCKYNAQYISPLKEYLCTKHAKKHTKYKIIDNTPNKLKIKELQTLAQNYNLNYGNVNKINLIPIIQDYQKQNFLTKIEKIKANEISLITVGQFIKIKLDDLFKEKNIEIKILDKILIENQLSKLAIRMKVLQGMLAQYFIMNHNNNIEFISSMNKLKNLTQEKTTT